MGKKLPLHELVETIRIWLEENKSYQQAADRLNITRGAVYRRVNSQRAKRIISTAKQDPAELGYLEKEVEDVLFEQYKHIAALETQIKELVQFRQIHTSYFYQDTVKFGLVSDTHMGSLYAGQDMLEAAYDVFAAEKVKDVYHCGDLTDGEKMYRGQEYEIFRTGCDAQIDEVITKYPRRKGVTTHFILGNHDMSFWKRAGINIGPKIAEARDDMFYLGVEEADIIFKGEDGRSAKVRLIHPGKGTAYAISYQIQKYIESLTGGNKPHVLLVGHYHKTELLPQYRNVYAVQAGTLERQTPFMRARNIAAHMGFWIIEFSVNVPKKVSRFKAIYFADSITTFRLCVYTHSG
jgi:predicted phosphodiesterase